MAMTPDENIMAHLKAKWVNEDKKCPICLANDWKLEPYFPVIQVATKDGITVPSATFPCFALMCSSCGFTHLFNAVVAGIVD